MWNDLSASTTTRRSQDGERLTVLELAAWRGLLRVQGRMLRRLDAAISRAHDLTLAEYEVLLRLSEQREVRMRLSSLADAIVRPRSSLTRVVGDLRDRGLVRREADPDDGRGASAVLTRKGQNVFREAQRTNLAEVRRLFLGHLDDAQLRGLADAWRSVDPSVLEPAPDEPPAADLPPAGEPVTGLVELRAAAGREQPLRAALTELVDRIRKEPACVSINAYQRTDDLTRFTIVETWRTADEFETFRTSSVGLRAYLERTEELLADERRLSLAREIA